MTTRQIPRRKRKVPCFALALVLLIAMASAASAEDRAPEPARSVDGYYPADPAGDRRAQGGRAAGLAGPVTVITQEDFRAWGARNLDEALSMVPGVYVTAGRVDPQLQQPAASVRGASPSGLRILVDGMPAGTLENGAVDLSHLTLEAISEVQILRGPAAAVYGGEAIGGVINIVTRKPTEGVSTDFAASYRAGQAYDYRLGIAGSAAWFGGLLTATHQDQRGFRLPGSFDAAANEYGNRRDHAEESRDRYFGKLRFDLGPYANLGAQAGYFRAQREVPVDQEELFPVYYDYPFWEEYDAALQLDVDSRKWFRAGGEAWYSRRERELVAAADEDGGGVLSEDRWRTDRFGGELAAYLDFDKWALLTLSGRYEEERLLLDDTDFGELDFAVAKSGGSLSIESNPIDLILLYAGASVDVFEGINSDAGKTGGDLITVNPVGSLTLAPLKGLSFTLSYARKVRFPTLRELYLTATSDFDLKEETANLYEFTVRYSYEDDVALVATGFWEDVQRVIRDPDYLAVDDTLKNAGTHRFQGGEIELRFTPVTGLLGRVGYTLVVAADLWDDAFSDKVYFVPAHRGFAELRYQFPFGLGLGWWARYVSDQQYFDDAEDRTLGSYVLNNARIYYEFRRMIEAFIDVTNIGDVYYEETRHYGRPGFSFQGGVRVRF